MKTKHFKKGTILQRKGDMEANVYHVVSGLLRSYTIDEQGKEHIFMFAPEDWLIADAQALGVPAELYIDVLEDAEVNVQERKELEAFHKEKLQRRMAVLQKRIIMLMSSSALVRYDHFVETYPQIVQRVPQKMIASYLGITPEALSRVKKERYLPK